MNKSKFLKKSLAMILAVMMIVAMIPLGASAAALPTLTAIDINGVTVQAEGTVFKADIPTGSSTVDVTATVGQGATLTAIGLRDGADATITTDTTATLTLANFQADAATANKVIIPLVLECSGHDHTANYSLELSKTSAKTTTELDTVSFPNQIGTSVINNATRTVTVSVPKGYTLTGSLTMTYTTKDGATVTGGTGTKNVSFTDGVSNANEIEVVSQSGGNSDYYTVVLKEIDILTGFAVDGVDGTIDQAKKTISVVLPADVLLDDDGEKLASGTAVNVPVTFTKAYGDAVVEVPTGTPFTSGNKVDVGTDLTAGNNYTKNITVTYNSTSVVYALTVTTVKSTDNTISAATVDGETATINGDQITVDLAKGTDLTNIAVGGLTFTVSEEVSAISVIANKATVAGSFGAPADGSKTWTSTATANVKNGAAITVTAADGTVKTYKLTVTATAVVNEPAISSATLKDAKGNEYKGVLSGNTYTFTVPYMTIDMSAWKFYFTGTTNTKFVAADGTTAISSGAAFGTGIVSAATSIPTTGAAGKMGAISKNDVAASAANPDAIHEYNVVIKLKAPVDVRKANVALTSVSVSYATAADKVTSANTRAAKLNSDKDGYDATIPYSATNTYLTAFAASNNGVVFFKANGGNYPNTPVEVATKDAFNTELTTGGKLVVIPEIAARAAIVAGNVNSIAANAGNEYDYAILKDAASSEKGINSMKFGDVVISLSASASVQLPYSMTIDSVASATAATAVFPTFVLKGEYATLKDNGGTVTFVTDGDTDGDGNADAISASNGALQFERQADGTVKAYMVSNADGKTGAAAITAFSVVAENGSKLTYYLPKLTFAAPNTEAKITSFKLAGATGAISGNTVNVTVPYGTKVSALAPTFTASSGATVALSGSPIKSGETVIDFTNDVKLTVTSEDGLHTSPYTVKVTVASQFSDVKEGTWYYNDVMTAAANGWVNGIGGGKFNPFGSMKRGDFAVMIAKVMDADLSSYTTSAFPDVPDGMYYTAAIAYCADKGYISGDGATGKFNPETAINREQMARIVCDAKGLTQVTNPTKKFTDDAKISGWAKGYVYACADAGIFVGDDNGNFDPKSPAQRNAGAAVLVRAFA